MMENMGLEHIRVFPLTLLKDITDNFSCDCEIGHGASGVVYKGVLDNGEKIAVKKLHNRYDSSGNKLGNGEAQFLNELMNLIGIQHPNIIRLVGYCYETHSIVIECDGKHVLASQDERVICLEYMPGGSLKDHLSDESSGLQWHARFNIIKGVCQGLKYLHTRSGNPIYHLDLKPENTWLDRNMIPKIGDFGISRLPGSMQTYSTENFVSGTIGYMAPEYIGWNQISRKCDVYSLGFIMIRVIAGEKGPQNYDPHMPSKEFIERVHKNWGKQQRETMSSHSLEQVKRCTKIALRCVEFNREKRPTIADIVDELNEIDAAESSDISQNTDEEEPTNPEKKPEVRQHEKEVTEHSDEKMEQVDSGCRAEGALAPAEDKLTVNTVDLMHLRKVIEEKDGGPPWIHMMDRSLPRMRYQVWQRDTENGLPQYRSSTILEEASTDVVRDFFWDDEFRMKITWDDMLLQHCTLDVCSGTGTTVVRLVRRFPFFCSEREYIIGRRIRASGNTYYCVTKSVSSPSVPRSSTPRRVDIYYSSWCIRPVESRNGYGATAACEVLFFHHEDMGIPLQVAKLGVPQTMWCCAERTERGLRAYQIARAAGEPISRFVAASSSSNSNTANESLFAPSWLAKEEDWAPLRCKNLALLATQNQCWTADRLARRGLPHPQTCPLCGQEDETISHLLIGCVFARQVWHSVLRHWSLAAVFPQQGESFVGWFEFAADRVASDKRKGAKLIILLTMWRLWRLRNDCVFHEATPDAAVLISGIIDEANQWKLAGAKALRRLTLHACPPDVASPSPLVYP